MAQFRIAREKRGGLVIGYRVQQEGWSRHICDGAGGQVWRNRGPRLFDLGPAEELLAHYERLARASSLPVEYEEVHPDRPASQYGLTQAVMVKGNKAMY